MNIYYEQRHRLVADYFIMEEKTDFSYPMHQHRCFEILLLLEGRMDCTVEEHTYPMTAGDLILVLPHQIHGIHTAVHSHHILCIFSPELIGSAAKQFTQYQMTSPVVPGSALCRQLFQEIRESDSTYKIKGFLYYLCDAFYVQLTDRLIEQSVNRDLDLLHRFFAYIETNYDGKCSLRALAQELNYSYSYLSKMFFANVRIHFDEYVARVRISKACDLLQNSRDPITSVASQCGYGSICSFNRNFKRIVGATPSEFRNHHLQKNE